MNNEIQKFYLAMLLPDAYLVVISAASVLLAMFFDLIAGLAKAKANGQARTSRGLKMTATKARKYFMPLLALVCFDVIGQIVYTLPYLTMAWAAFCVFIEFKSIRESAWEKAEIQRHEEETIETVKLMAKFANLIKRDPAEVAEMLDELQKGRKAKTESSAPDSPTKNNPELAANADGFPG